MYQKHEALLLKATNNKDYSTELQEVTSFYGDDFNDSEFSTQLQIFSTSFTKGIQSHKTTLQEALEGLQSVSQGQQVNFLQASVLSCQSDSCHACNKCSEQTVLFHQEEGKELFVKHHRPVKDEPCHVAQHIQWGIGSAQTQWSSQTANSLRCVCPW